MSARDGLDDLLSSLAGHKDEQQQQQHQQQRQSPSPPSRLTPTEPLSATSHTAGSPSGSGSYSSSMHARNTPPPTEQTASPASTAPAVGSSSVRFATPPSASHSPSHAYESQQREAFPGAGMSASAFQNQPPIDLASMPAGPLPAAAAGVRSFVECQSLHDSRGCNMQVHIASV